MGIELMLKNVRLSFPELFKPTQFQGTGDAKYRAHFIIPKNHPQMKEIQEAILAAATAEWKTKAPAIVKSLQGNDMKFCLRSGDSKPDYDGYEGNMYVAAASKVRPTVIDRNKAPLTEEDGKPYGGCYVNVKLDVYATSKMGNGIFMGLKGVQFCGDGDAFKGGGSPASVDDFDDIATGSDAEDLF